MPGEEGGAEIKVPQVEGRRRALIRWSDSCSSGSPGCFAGGPGGARARVVEDHRLGFGSRTARWLSRRCIQAVLVGCAPPPRTEPFPVFPTSLGGSQGALDLQRASM